MAPEVNAKAGSVGKELKQLRGELNACTGRRAARDENIRAADDAAARGSEDAELRLVALKAAQVRDEATFERLTRRVGVLEAEEAREAGLTHLIALARQADAALTKFDTLQVQAQDRFEALIAELYEARREFLTLRSEFLQLAGTLAPGLREVLPEKRADAKALLATLRDRGAELRAIGVNWFGGSPTVFENAAPYQPPALERWGWLLHQALDGYARAEVTRKSTAEREAAEQQREVTHA